MQKSRMFVVVGALLLIALGGLTVGVVQALTSGTPEVRLAAQIHSDGRFEVALQQRLDDGGWSERMLPPKRFLAADAESARWRYSSPLALEISNLVSGNRACLVTHGDPSDPYWTTAHAVAEAQAAAIGLELMVVADPDSEIQAAFVRQCSAVGVSAIVTTLADPEVLGPALAEAQAAGIAVLTFNSGARAAKSLGSVFHAAIDDYGSGQASGEALIEDEVEGIALCVIHEQRNVGLEERCDGLEATYSSVERLRVHETGTRDLDATQAVIAERLANDDDIAALLTLNQSIGIAALRAIEAGDDQAVLVTFGLDDEITEALAAGRIRYAIDDQTTEALEYMLLIVRNLPISLSLFPDSPIFLFRSAMLDMEAAQHLLAERQADLAGD